MPSNDFYPGFSGYSLLGRLAAFAGRGRLPRREPRPPSGPDADKGATLFFVLFFALSDSILHRHLSFVNIFSYRFYRDRKSISTASLRVRALKSVPVSKLYADHLFPTLITHPERFPSTYTSYIPAPYFLYFTIPTAPFVLFFVVFLILYYRDSSLLSTLFSHLFSSTSDGTTFTTYTVRQSRISGIGADSIR